MTAPEPLRTTDYYPNFKIFLELMARKVREILLVSSPYDAFIIEQDGSLASRIVNEYSGLNLSQPPRVTRTGSGSDALEMLEKTQFDLVITMPYLEDMSAIHLAGRIKALQPDLPVILLAHSMRGLLSAMDERDTSLIDKLFVWSGNADLLLALVKHVEDRLNVKTDTQRAGVRVLVMVEDTPIYYSTLLPLIYREIVTQTQAVLGEGLNEEHRLLKMRARPKILLAETYEEALDLCHRYKDYLFGIISDARFPKEGRLNEDAGLALLSHMRQEIPDLPLLMMSSEPKNWKKAASVPAAFLDKNSPNLLNDLHDFFLNHLGFGDFVFRLPDGTEVGRADSLRELEAKIAHMPDDTLWYHARRNHFSNWIMGRSEIVLASHFRGVPASEFTSADDLRAYLIQNIHALRKWRQKGVVSQFRPENFDADIMDFIKIGEGSLGGKARGLAFMATMLQENPKIFQRYPDIAIQIPKTLVIGTDGFESFVSENRLQSLVQDDVTDAKIRSRFMQGRVPDWLVQKLQLFLDQVRCPLSVRSSSLLEDAHFQPYAGLYETYMIPNNHPDPERRLTQLLDAIRLVYASTYYENPRSFTRKTMSTPQKEAMAVIVQELTGREYGDFYYPAIAGAAQSYNYYPISRMGAEDGIAHIALGFGRTVMEGEQTLRFSPRHPRILPQFSTVDDILVNAQRHFYALRIRNYPDSLAFDAFGNLERRVVEDAADEPPVRLLAGTYVPDEHRIRESGSLAGAKILTFASVLKHRVFPLSKLLSDFLDLGRKGMGCPVEIEFAVDLAAGGDGRGTFHFLQMRPMGSGPDGMSVEITGQDREEAFCVSLQSLGNGVIDTIYDVVYVKRHDFQVEATLAMAEEIGRMNGDLLRENRPYLLVGPGRWGSADRWLGIPVRWKDISSVGAIVELRTDLLKADPSQGSHFFQNITALGIPYITVSDRPEERFHWEPVERLEGVNEMAFIRHVRCRAPLKLKIDGRTSEGVVLGV